jgi:putative aminopeptidase FrvX
VWVGDDGPIPGVVALPPAHLTRGEERPVLRYEELRIDIGAESAAEAAAMAPLGSMVTFATPFAETETHVIGKAFDDRAGCHLAALAFTEPVAGPLWAVFTVQEETGLRGARVAARRLRPDAALVLEGTPAGDAADAVAGRELTRVGKGAALTVVDRTTLPHARLKAALVEAAERAAVPWQWRRGLGGGTDAGALWPEGIPAATVSLPCRYIHAPAAVAAKSDLEAIRRLVAAFLAMFPEVMRRVG